MSNQNLSTSQATDHGLDTWRQLRIDQQPTWSEHEDFESTIAELNSVPPLVFAGEVDAMRQALGEVAEGRAFLLQGGDCAETFAGATSRQDLRPRQDHPADVCSAHLRRLHARGEDGS